MSAFGFLDGVVDANENLISAPSAGAPRGFIGQASLQHVYRFWTEVDLAAPYYKTGELVNPASPEFVPPYAYRTGPDTGPWWYMWRSAEHADKVAKMLKPGSFGGQHVISVAMNMETLLSEIKSDSWKNGIGGEIELNSFRVKNFTRAIPFQAIFLPVMVEAIAFATKMITERPLTGVLASINAADRQDRASRKAADDAGDSSLFVTAFTPDFQKEVVGFEETSYWQSALGLGRTALWAMLGESDPRNYRYGDGPFVTKSESLTQCLQLVSSNWKRALWARISLIPNPAVDAVSKSGGRLSIACISDLFESEEAAREALPPPSAVVEHEDGALTIPLSWQAFPEMWKNQVKGLKDLYATATDIPDEEVARTGATLADFEAWWEKV